MYLRNVDGRPVGCIAISSSKNERDFNYQISVQNPKDKFSKPLARQLALGRLEESPIEIKNVSHENIHDISRAVMKDILNSKNMPARAIKSAKNWLKNN